MGQFEKDLKVGLFKLMLRPAKERDTNNITSISIAYTSRRVSPSHKSHICVLLLSPVS